MFRQYLEFYSFCLNKFFSWKCFVFCIFFIFAFSIWILNTSRNGVSSRICKERGVGGIPNVVESKKKVHFVKNPPPSPPPPSVRDRNPPLRAKMTIFWPFLLKNRIVFVNMGSVWFNGYYEEWRGGGAGCNVSHIIYL